MNCRSAKSAEVEAKLPVARGSSGPGGGGSRDPIATRAPKRAASGPVRVLCVDDHAVLVEGLRAQFSITGDIQVVGRLATADRLLEEVERLKPDAVLLDIEMPGADVFEMADRLRRRRPEVRVIVLSAHIRDGYISAAFAAGVCAYFAKSDELENIVRGIHDVVRHRGGTFVLGPMVRERCRPIATDKPGAAGLREPEIALTGAGVPITHLDSLTAREAEILRLIGKGLSRTQIAAQLCRSVKTIDGHQDRMMKKLGIVARADLMRFAIREGLAQA